MRRFLLTGLAVLAFGVMSVGVASAQVGPPGSQQVNTSATISGVGSGGPTVIAAFALPDMSPNDSAFTYCGPSGNHTDTTDIATIPFKPNLLDSPITRQVRFFVVLSGAAGPGDIGSVYVDVFHPGGGKKFELSMNAIANTAAQGFLGSPTTPCQPLSSAIATGQVAAGTGANGADTIFANVGFGKPWRVYEVIGVVSKDQPFGDYVYWFLATAAGSSGTTQSPNQTFTVLQNMGFAIDFGAPAPTVNWGMIKPGVMQQVTGDYIWANGIPSVMATGNVYLNLNALWSTLVGQTYGKIIDRYFDIALGTQSRPRLVTAQGTREILSLQAPVYQGMITAGTPIDLTGYTLESDIPTQVDLSLTAFQAGFADTDPQATGLPQDTYVGRMWLWGTASAVQNPFATQNLVWPPQ